MSLFKKIMDEIKDVVMPAEEVKAEEVAPVVDEFTRADQIAANACPNCDGSGTSGESDVCGNCAGKGTV